MHMLMMFVFAEILFPISFFIIVTIFINSIRNNIRRMNNHSYFKQNVINSNLINIDSDFLDVTLNSLKQFQNKTNQLYKENYNDVSSEKLKLLNVTNIEDFKEYFYKLFTDFEKAYNSLDYKKMESLSTSQLFENYYTGISLDLKAGNKRIIENIVKKRMTIFELDSTVSKQIVSTFIEISYNNYMVNKNGEVISGQKDKITESFVVQFRKDFNKKSIINCPNCGAPIESSKCPYCDSVVDYKNDFKISSIKKII